MRKKTTYLFGVLASLIIGSFLHFSLCAHTDEITKPAVITKGQKNKLKSLAMLLNKSKDAQCMIVGHTDSIEHKRHPRLLGKSRAEFTKRTLMKYKVNPKKIKITSHGSSKPIAMNKTDEGRALNRRTVVIIN
ncbi:MAG: Outer membrane porin F [Formosa sp. Hel3_A1_48]|jgi:outer membrane protein OmpA-like peptidoglycan-associated protein|nr:MAG: Outer membrane porin F [Formosa sp. Hel3_A1_48]